MWLGCDPSQICPRVPRGMPGLPIPGWIPCRGWNEALTVIKLGRILGRGLHSLITDLDTSSGGPPRYKGSFSESQSDDEEKEAINLLP